MPATLITYSMIAPITRNADRRFTRLRLRRSEDRRSNTFARVLSTLKNGCTRLRKAAAAVGSGDIGRALQFGGKREAELLECNRVDLVVEARERNDGRARSLGSTVVERLHAALDYLVGDVAVDAVDAHDPAERQQLLAEHHHGHAL